MKNLILLIASISVTLVSACNQVDEGNSSDASLPSNEGKKQIASNFRSESNIVFEEAAASYMGQFKHREFLALIFDAIYAGNIRAYDFLDDPIPIEDIKYMQSHIDTTEVENIETGVMETVLIEEVLNPDEVVKIFTSEDWFLNKENFTIEKKVISMTLTTLKLDLEGDPIGYEILFKIYLDGRDQLQ